MFKRPLGVLLDHQHGDAGVAHARGSANSSCTISGDRPIDGSSISISLRFEQQPARDLQQLLLAARERRGLRSALRRSTGKRSIAASMRAARSKPSRRRDAAELEIVPHRQLGKDVAALRHVADAARRAAGAASRLVMSRPSNLCGRRAPAACRTTALKTVDLPAPLGPITVVIAPRATRRSSRSGSSSCRSRRRRPRSARISSVAKIGLDHFGIARGSPPARPRR